MNVETTASRSRWRPRGMDLRLAIAICLTFGALALLVAATWVNTFRLLGDAAKVDHTREVIGELESTFSTVKDAETAERGFLLTSEDAYLEPFRLAAGQLPRRIERLLALTADNETQRARVDRFRQLASEWVEQLGKRIDLARAGKRDAVLALIASSTNRRTMDALSGVVAEMRAEEGKLLAARDRRSKDTVRSLLTTLAIGAVLLFGFLFLIWYLVRADLTRRNRSEAEIRAREARIRRLLNANLIGVLFSDDAGVTDANDAFISMAGYERETWNPRQHTLFGFTAPEFRTLDESCENELRERGTCRPYQKEILRRDGTRVPVLFGSTSVDMGGGTPVRASFVVDLSELKRVEAERNRLYEEARDAVKARDSFLSVAGHEIRSPLAALNLLVYQLSRQMRGVGNARATDLVHRCEKQVLRLIRLTDELLDVSRITAGTLHLDPEEMDLAQLARDVVERFEENARRAGCKLSVTAGESVVGFWDRSRLDQVITNLLTNAMKFGAGQPVEIGVCARGDVAQFTVEDRGIGIHDADQRRIFDRFERAVSKETYAGMGLGLWITREIVEAHGGKVGVESRPGAGATFRLTLPRGQGGESESPHHRG
jgi:PAS domain S-box-containing protein